MAPTKACGRRSMLRAALLVLPVAGCNQAKVVEEQAYAGPRLPMPSRILVRDFAVSPAEVRLDQGIRGRVEQGFSAASSDEQRLAAARAAASALAEALVQALRASPDLPVERIPPGAAPMPGRSLVVEGRLLAVDEGNRTQRTLIGFGRGEARMEAEAALYWIEPGAAPRRIEAFDGTTDSGRAPGMAASLGAGAAARRLATSAALGGGAHGAIEGSRADDTDEAKRIGTALGARVKRFCVAQGWVAAGG
ncbi:DUF4410 domain-containing protein [Dankookia rubra]|uniref:DUF4410 domain-containing protein n=1 Tax=Dankookia rubra TaxID=1442381 RepID=A0A4R5Q962_9PROT|nr:DUF4410 domain-containing protein [Dankookia rubra]TDH59079.1 DUF4410 domain-containing protein [Dankookia rubra]